MEEKLSSMSSGGSTLDRTLTSLYQVKTTRKKPDNDLI
jgi:hypothetical protein